MNLAIYNPQILGSFTEEIARKCNELGLNKEGVNRLNVERYINKLQRLQADGMQLSIMPEQTKEMVLTAIYQNPAAIQFASDQDEHSKAIVINVNPTNIKYILNPTDVDVQMAIDLEPSSILFAKRYSKEKAMNAIEKNIKLIFSIEKSYVDEEMMLFVLCLAKDKKNMENLWDKYINNTKSRFNSPLTRFSNEEIKRVAYEINPVFLNYISPKELSEDQIVNILKEDPFYYEKMVEEEFVITKKMIEPILRWRNSCGRYNIFSLIGSDCLDKEVLKKIVDELSKFEKVHFEDVLCYLEKNTGFFDLFFEENIEYIFKDNGIFNLRYLPEGYSNKKVIKLAIKQNKENKKCLNFWNTKVKRS